MGQYLSMTSYLTVLNIGRDIAVRNQRGQTMSMSKELLETMYGGSHYERIVYMNKTGLAELLMSVQDVIFTVNFFKQVSENSI